MKGQCNQLAIKQRMDNINNITIGSLEDKNPNFELTLRLTLADKKNRKYLYHRKKAIPIQLFEKIKDMSITDQDYYSYIVGMILACRNHQTKHEKRNNFFVCINRKVWLNKIGTHYKSYLINLVIWGIIEINNYYNIDKGITKSYRLCNINFDEYIIIILKKEKFQVLKDKKANLKEIEADSILRYLYKQLQNVTTKPSDSDELIPNLPKDIMDCVSMYSDKIFSGQHNIHRGPKSGRIYHSIICAPRILRNYLKYRDKPYKWIIDHDIKTAFPTFLLKFITNPEERKNYISYLEGDIYLSIIEYFKKFYYSINSNISIGYICVDDERYDCKVEFQRFINGFQENLVYHFFKDKFPNLFEFIKNNNEKMAEWLQKMESSVIIDILVPYCIKNNIQNYYNMHDGYHSDGSHDEELNKLIIDEFEKILNYRVTIKTTVLGDSDNDADSDSDSKNNNNSNYSKLSTGYICVDDDNINEQVASSNHVRLPTQASIINRVALIPDINWENSMKRKLSGVIEYKQHKLLNDLIDKKVIKAEEIPKAEIKKEDFLAEWLKLIGSNN